MNIEDHIQFWLDGADHDLDVAESLFSTGKYDWWLFLAQLVIEKALKATWVRDSFRLEEFITKTFLREELNLGCKEKSARWIL